MSLIPQDWLCEFASFITERFTHRDQLSNLEILLSRANSYMGKKLPVSVYLKLASNVRTRCLQVLRHNEMTHQESELRCLLRALIRDSWHENNFISRYSSIPYQHVVNDDYNCDMMMLDNIDDLEALYRLEARDELELNATAVSDTESVSSLSVSTESESPEGLRPFIDLEDSETLLSDADSDEGTDKSKSASGV
ncbi:hypothetical protein EST38_g7177 [Candolleomyces aberdarensis]|uniref:Uncharacterized protein n=1 Tax=Candolleomyces aberdarensis TaxID=2316362 RepID=A0A4Q2DHY4_9AGAR|nr:hypothetical protein EST38_g7177 [Candolleomyces aberdarensis]